MRYPENTRFPAGGLSSYPQAVVTRSPLTLLYLILDLRRQTVLDLDEEWKNAGLNFFELCRISWQD